MHGCTRANSELTLLNIIFWHHPPLIQGRPKSARKKCGCNLCYLLSLNFDVFKFVATLHLVTDVNILFQLSINASRITARESATGIKFLPFLRSILYPSGKRCYTNITVQLRRQFARRTNLRGPVAKKNCRSIPEFLDFWIAAKGTLGKPK